MPLANAACSMQQELTKENPIEIVAPRSVSSNFESLKKINSLLDNTLDLSNMATLPDSSAVQSRVASTSQVDTSFLSTINPDLINNILSITQSSSQNDLKRIEMHHQHQQLQQQQQQLQFNQIQQHLRQQNQQSNIHQNFLQSQTQLQQHFQQQLQQSNLLDQFIPGTISNRTLEQLTESTLRAGRPIKGELRFDLTPTAGTIGDRLMQTPNNTPLNMLGMNGTPGNTLLDILNRTISPSDSDTSGVSSGVSSGGADLSEAAIVELMNSLQMGQSSSFCPYPAMTPPPVTNGCFNGQSPTMDLLKSLSLQADNGHRSFVQQSLYNDFNADLFGSRPWTALNTLFTANSADPNSIDRAAKMYRSAATISEPTCTWSGQLPLKSHRNPVYSVKVFLGGVPWDINEVGLQNCFRNFGSLKIEWPGKDGKHPRFPNKGREFPVGYVYILFESERSVRSLLQACTHDFTNGAEYYFKISSKRMRSKEVQVIPWVISDSNYVKNPSQRLDPQKTIFVGALHGMLNAEGLSNILNDLFGNVVYAGIDTDKYKYPIGSGRVTFNSTKSYMKAVTAAFVEIKTAKFTKKIQIDPYLEESPCSVCLAELGPYFCRDFNCFRYYCRACWQTGHSSETMRYHKPLMRNNKTSGCAYPVIEAPNFMM